MRISNMEKRRSHKARHNRNLKIRIRRYIPSVRDVSGRNNLSFLCRSAFIIFLIACDPMGITGSQSQFVFVCVVGYLLFTTYHLLSSNITVIGIRSYNCAVSPNWFKFREECCRGLLTDRNRPPLMRGRYSTRAAQPIEFIVPDHAFSGLRK